MTQHNDTTELDGVKLEPEDERFIYPDQIGGGIGNKEFLTHDDKKLKDLLRSFDLDELYDVLKRARISFKNLKYLNKDDIKEAIKPVGLRAEFREKLFSYLKSEPEAAPADDDTLSNNSKVIAWLRRDQVPDQMRDEDEPSPQPTALFNSRMEASRRGFEFNLNSWSLLHLLKSSSKGNSIITFYNENSCLSKNQRDDLIEIILEDVLTKKELKLRPENFKQIVLDIVSIFPSENQNQEYYFIPRQNKKNPRGKLYSKYFNLKTKNRNRNLSNHSISSVEEPEAKKVKFPDPEESEGSETEESISLSLKNFLKRDCSNWEEIEDMWGRTFTLRQADFEKYSKADFLLEWPRYNDERAPSLINLDFKLIHPGKEDLLKIKWDRFKTKIMHYYKSNIRNPQSKTLMIQALETKEKDCNDYILAVLLNSILVPTARFRTSDGKTTRKASIHDASESFVLLIADIGDLKSKLKDLFNKGYQSEMTLQPYIIVEGSSPESLEAFYVYFDKTLFKFDSFIESLDICFKIFQVFNLSYPQTCEFPWNFIQQHFYEINRSSDCKSPNLTSLINYMRKTN